MKQLLVTFLILVLFCPALRAQPVSQPYMKDMLILKFKPGASTLLGGKQKATPKDRVQQMLSSLGSSGLKPVWTPAFERGLQKARQRGKVAFDQDPAAELRRTYSVKLPQGIDSRMLAAKLSRMPGITYAEPRYLYKTTYVPNDPKAGVQLPTHNFYDAFDITKGSSDVIIAIVDSGVDYNHEDLNDKLWINQDEIPNNGIDDDNNGFIDDDKGWDFWQSGTNGNYQQDNDPMGEYSDHGTHVAGIAAAETDNGIGVAGAGFNSTYMAVKAGGIQDDPNTPDNESDLIGFGYEGIMYAANNGADVINCSWGGGGISQLGEDAINFATRMGAVVVAAAGNESTGSLNFPAADQYVLSVGSVDSTTDQKSSFSNFGYDLDVLADGLFVRSTVFNNSYGIKSGTSMSTPVVSGLAALIKAQHPGWSAMRINRQIRGSARNIDDFNPQFANRLGKGAIDAQAALQDPLPGIMVKSADFFNTKGGKLFVGETGTAELKLINYGSPTSDLNVSLSTPDEGITISTSTVSVGALATDDSATVTFDLDIAEDFNLSTTPLFRVDFAAQGGSYSDFNYVRYDDILYDVLAANNVKTSFGADGTIGFTHPQNGTGGVGFIPRRPTNGSYQEGDNLLFEGGLMLEINGTMADAVRGADNTFNRDFRPLQNYQLTDPGSLSDIDGHMAFDTGNESALQALSVVNMSTYAFRDPELSNVVFLKYEIRNTDPVQLLNNVYVGLFNDWDIGNSFDNNLRYSSADSLLYAYEPGSDGPYVAVAQLGNAASNFAIDNAYSATEDSLHFSIYPDQGTYSGFGDKEKQWSLHAREYVTQQSNTDVSTVVSSGPYEVRPGATITVGFVYAFGNTLDELRTQVAAARNKKVFQVSTAGAVGPVNQEMPRQTTLYQNYPNPFNPSTIVKFDISESGPTSLRVYDVLGRRVATVFEREMRAGSYAYQYTPHNLSSGVYLMVLQSPSGTETVKFSYLK